MIHKTKHFLRRALLLIGLLLLILIVLQYELIIYGIRQGYGQFEILYHAQPITEVLVDKNYPDSLKQKLLLVEEIKKFAFDSLQINYSKNYTAFYNQKGKPILWIVTACEPYNLKAKEWDFPFVGKVSYKGFFAKKLVKEEAEELKKEGYDVDIDEVAGWSTLGWFKDPVLSSMLKNNEGNLANLLIHELTHGTLFIKNNVEFNENLADFVGDYGATRFLLYKYGKNSLQFKDYENSKTDYKLFSEHILSGTKKLDSLYKNMKPGQSVKEKDTLKYRLIKKIITSIDTVSFANNKWKKRAHIKKLPNNAYFIDYIRYRSQQNIFNKEFKERFNSNFKLYFAFLKQKYPI